MFGGGFKASKCKTLLRLAMSRIKLLRNKRDIQIKQMRKDIAQLLQTGQEPSARIRVEHIIREQNTVAAYDILELFCELIIVRLPIIEAQKVCPVDLKEAIASVIFASPRCADIPELVQIRTLFATKYGKEFVAAAAELRPDCGVNRRIIEKLSTVRPPTGEAKLKLLKEIASEYKVEWDPADAEAELLKVHDDLLDGSTHFVSASSMPLPVTQSNAVSHRPQNVPLHPPPPPASSVPPATSRQPIQMLPLDQHSSSDEASPPESKPSKTQYVPFAPPHPDNKRVSAEASETATTSSLSSTSGKYDSQKATFRGDSKKGEAGHDKPVRYESAEAAAQAAAKSAIKATNAARAAARLARTHSSSPSPPHSRRGRKYSDSDEDESEEEQPRKANDKRRLSSNSKEESTRQEKRDTLPKRNDSDKRRESAALSRKNVEEEKEFSFRTSIQDDRRASFPKRSDPEDRDEPSFWRGSSEDPQEGSYRRSYSEDRKEAGRRSRGKADDPQEGSYRRSNTEERKESVRRSNSGDGQGVVFRTSSSGDRQRVFSDEAEDQQDGSFSRKEAESRPAFDVEPPRKVDPENESFWKPANQDQDWRFGSDTKASNVIDSAVLFASHPDEEDTSRRGSRNSNTSNLFSREDSAESNLFKRSDSAEVDLRSSDESLFYDSKQGLPTPKFDDEEFASSRSKLKLSTQREEDTARKLSSSSNKSPVMKPSFNDFWRAESLSHNAPEDDELFVKKLSFAGREDTRPLGKAKSETSYVVDTHLDSTEIERAGSDPLVNRSSSGQPAFPTKSRRTRMNKDKSDDAGSVGSPVRRSGTYSRESQQSPPRTYDDSAFDSPPPSRTAPRFKAAPSSNSSAYHSPETQRESPPLNAVSRSPSGSSTNSSPISLHPKLPDYDDLTARFEALKSLKR